MKGVREWMRRQDRLDPQPPNKVVEGKLAIAELERDQQVGFTNNRNRPNFLRLELPRFDGTNASSWISHKTATVYHRMMK